MPVRAHTGRCSWQLRATSAPSSCGAGNVLKLLPAAAGGAFVCAAGTSSRRGGAAPSAASTGSQCWHPRWHQSVSMNDTATAAVLLPSIGTGPEAASLHSIAAGLQVRPQEKTAEETSQQLLQLACAGRLFTCPDDPRLLPRLHAALRAALEGAAELLQRKPPVDNAQRLHRRIRSDLRFLETAAAAAGLSPENAVVLESQSKDIPPPHLASSTGAAAAGFNAAPGSGGGDVALLPPPPFKTRVLTAARLQGIANNLRGHTGELLAAQVHVACVAATAAAAAAATTVPLTAITHLALSACAADYVSNSVCSQLSWPTTHYRLSALNHPHNPTCPHNPRRPCRG